MSYDLWFTSKKPISVETMREYFAEQPNMHMSEGRAGYENEVTGIYFGFDFAGESADPEPGRVPVAFNINYFRPHTFGLEAEPVLTAFVDEFQLGIDDPQMDGMGQGPYSGAGFIRGWNAGNTFGHRAIMSGESAPTPLTLPAVRVEGLWRWNFAKADTTEHFFDLIGEAPPCFVPTIMYFQTGEASVSSLVVWDTKMAIAIPDVDLVLTTIDGGAPIVAPTSDVLSMLKVHTTWKPDYEVTSGQPVGLVTRLIDDVPPDLSLKIRAAMRPFQPMRRVSPDEVLDAELVAESRRS